MTPTVTFEVVMPSTVAEILTYTASQGYKFATATIIDDKHVSATLADGKVYTLKFK